MGSPPPVHTLPRAGQAGRSAQPRRWQPCLWKAGVLRLQRPPWACRLPRTGQAQHSAPPRRWPPNPWKAEILRLQRPPWACGKGIRAGQAQHSALPRRWQLSLGRALVPHLQRPVRAYRVCRDHRSCEQGVWLQQPVPGTRRRRAPGALYHLAARQQSPHK